MGRAVIALAALLVGCAGAAAEAPSPASTVRDTGAKARVLAASFHEPERSSARDEARDSPDRTAIAEAAGPRHGHGRRITIDVVAAPLTEVVRLVADVGRVNVVVDESAANVRVTVRLRDVRGDDALAAIVASKGLVSTRMGTVYVVSSQKGAR